MVIQLADDTKGVALDLVALSGKSNARGTCQSLNICLPGLPPCVKNIFESDTIIKVINDPTCMSFDLLFCFQYWLYVISADVGKLFNDFGVNICSVVNIATLTESIFPTDFISPYSGGVSLSILTRLVLGYSLDKGPQKSQFFPPYSDDMKYCESSQLV